MFIYLRHWLLTIGANPDIVKIYIVMGNEHDKMKAIRELNKEGIVDNGTPPVKIAGIKVDFI